jgi:hypothetical protein
VAYDRSTRLGRGDTQAADVVASANEHIASLAGVMGKLSLDLRGATVADVDVEVDGEKIAPDEVRSDVVVEPGPHRVDIAGRSLQPAHSSVSVEQGHRVVLTIELKPAARFERSYTRRNVGIGLIAGGGAVGIGAIVTLLVRQNLIDTIQSDCPGNVCPASLHDSIESMRSTATALMPLAVILGGVGIVAGGIGITLVALGPTSVTIGGTF